MEQCVYTSGFIPILASSGFRRFRFAIAPSIFGPKPATKSRAYRSVPYMSWGRKLVLIPLYRICELKLIRPMGNEMQSVRAALLVNANYGDPGFPNDTAIR